MMNRRLDRTMSDSREKIGGQVGMNGNSGNSPRLRDLDLVIAVDLRSSSFSALLFSLWPSGFAPE